MRPTLALVALLYAGSAHAFCGFFVAGSNQALSNDASKVVLLREGNKTSMTMSNNYKGPTESFAMVVPVPVVLHEKDVKTLAADVFDHIDQLTAPRLVEYWERDPCAPPMVYPMAMPKGAVMEDGAAMPTNASHGVKVEAHFAVGEYQIEILSAQQANGLELWLREHKYTIPKGAAEALQPYVKSQMKFFVAKVDIGKVHRDKKGVVVLSPLRVRFESQDVRLPVRLGLLNSSGKQDLIVYVLNPTARFEVANYKNVFVPTNLEVLDQVRTAFASFYAQLFDETLSRAQNKAVVTEYAWDSGSCDPCPVPPLEESDLATLGAETPSSSWVLTRMHTRYSKESLSEDLVFKQGKPIEGGRANWDGKSEGSTEMTPSSSNNYQARYIIRHYWNGAVKCDHPTYDTWGGPPDGRESTTAAKDLASAPRNAVSLTSVVRSKVPALDLPGLPAPKRNHNAK
jgi:hypothetical protein